jgi:hypothetical protein
MHSIQFTDEFGHRDEWIVAENIVSFRSVKGRTSLELTNGKYVLVSETPEQVARLIAEAGTPPVAAIGAVPLAVLQSGDTLVVSVDGVLGSDQRSRLESAVQTVLPAGFNVLALDRGAALHVVRTAKAVQA